MSSDSPFLETVEAFLKNTGMSPTAFGKSAIGDPNFVLDLRRGREPRSRLVQRARDFMRDHATSKTAE